LTTVETLAEEATPERRGLSRAGTDAMLEPFTESIRMDGLHLLQELARLAGRVGTSRF
jgi:hypothetical protein